MMRKLQAVTLLSGALLLGACNQATTEIPESTSSTTTAGTKASDLGITPLSPTGRWFIELEGEPGSLSTQSLISQQQGVRLAAQAAGIDYEEVASYHTLFNGFSVKIDDADVAAFSRLPQVKAVYPVDIVHKPQVVEGATPDMVTAVELTGADYAQNEMGLTGEGVKVGIIDTGIDMQHAAFAGRIAYAYDFVGDDFDISANPIPEPDNDPDDCDGHGSHVAGIVGGNDPITGFKGVAPEVTFGVYRVFSCYASTTSDIMLQAMEQAAQDGMDIVNMSIGASFQWAEYPTAKAADRLVKRGIFVTISAGNSQDKGQFATGAPSLAEKAISVAAVYNSQLQLSAFEVALGEEKMNVGFYAGKPAPAPEKGSSFEVVIADPLNACNVAGVNPYAANAFKGKAVLIQRGSCSFAEKAANLAAAGAAAVIMFNNGVGYVSPSLGKGVDIPYVSIAKADGEKMKAAIEAGVTPKVTFTGEKVAVDDPQGGGITDFSSYGAGPDLELKPEISAPGGKIYSAWSDGGYNTISGTSMAAPHVAGAAALILDGKPDINPEEMKIRMMNTASVRDFFYKGEFLTGLPIYTQLQGAGLLDIPSAYRTELLATPAKLSLGESEGINPHSKVVVLHNRSDADKVLTVTHLPALTLAGGTFTPEPDDSQAYVEVNSESAEVDEEGKGGVAITVPAGGTAELNIRIFAPKNAPDFSQYGGFILVKNGKDDLTIPYGGFKGDYQKLRVLGDVIFKGDKAEIRNFPAFYDPARDNLYFEGEEPEKVPVFTFLELQSSDGIRNVYIKDMPTIWANFSHQAQEVVLEAVELTDSAQIVDTHKIERLPFVGRDAGNIYTVGSDSVPWTEFVWDGEYADGTEAPAGFYQLRLRVLKALGNPNNPNHWESYTSPMFRVVRAAKTD